MNLLQALTTQSTHQQSKAIFPAKVQIFFIWSQQFSSHLLTSGTVNGEYYADVETQCQVQTMKIIKIEIFRFQMFHVCSHLANGLAQRFSFLCPNGECEKLYIDSVLTESVFGKPQGSLTICVVPLLLWTQEGCGIILVALVALLQFGNPGKKAQEGPN